MPHTLGAHARLLAERSGWRVGARPAAEGTPCESQSRRTPRVEEPGVRGLAAGSLSYVAGEILACDRDTTGDRSGHSRRPGRFCATPWALSPGLANRAGQP